jgi:hypothetical protein
LGATSINATKALVPFEQAVLAPVTANINVTRIAAAAKSRKPVLTLFVAQFDNDMLIAILLHSD